MSKREGALVAGAVLLWLLLSRKGAQSGASTTAPGVTFPPVVAIGGGQVQAVESPGFVGWVMQGVDAVTGMVRGFRNHNPLNIEYKASNAWLGQVGSDGRYAVFSEDKYGIRAAGKILDSYVRRGVKTVRQIISEWAPPKKDGKVENDTESYIRHVIQQTGWGAGYVPARTDFARLLAAMIKHENGKNPFSYVELAEWLMIP